MTIPGNIVQSLSTDRAYEVGVMPEGNTFPAQIIIVFIARIS